MEQMAACQTCGVKGFSNLLIHCVQCQIVGVHRYCVDGPPTIDDEEVFWSCEDCAPRVAKPASPSRKSERIITKIDRQALRQRARKKWNNNLSLLEAGKPDNKREISAKVTTNPSDLDNERYVGILDIQQGRLEADTTPQLPQVSDDVKMDASVIVNSVNEDAEKMLRGSRGRPLKRSTVMEQKSPESASLIRQKKDFNSEKWVKRPDDSLLQHEHKCGHSLNDVNEAKTMLQDRRNPLKQSTAMEPKNPEFAPLIIQKKDLDFENGVKRKDDSSVLQPDHECGPSLNDVNEAAKEMLQRNRSPLKRTTVTEQESPEPGNMEAVRLTRQKDEDSSPDADDEDQWVKLKLNVGTQLCNEPDSIKGSTCEAYDKKDRHSISEQGCKIERSCTKIHLNSLEELPSNSNTQAAKLPDRGDQGSEVVEKTTPDSLDNPGVDTQSSCANSECRIPRKKRRRFVIEMEYSDEDPAHVLSDPSTKSSDVGDGLHMSSSEPHVMLNDQVPPQPSPTNEADYSSVTSIVKLAEHLLTQPTSTKLVNHVPSKPIIDAIWSGYCGISNSIYSESFGLEAHLSSKALPKVHGAASALPKHIDFEIVPKRYGWPKSFKQLPPTGDAIGLYFFPVGERDERLYDAVIDKMIDRHLMLMSRINNLELLVFSSRELPEGEWRFQSKYYLWGVFRPTQENSEQSQPQAIQISNAGPSVPAYVPYDARYQELKDLEIPGGTRASASPSRMDNHSGVHFPNSQGVHNALNCYPEDVFPSDLRHPKPFNGAGGYKRQSDSNRRSSLANRRNDCRSYGNGRRFFGNGPRSYGNGNRSYGKFRQHQAKFDSHASDIREVSHLAKDQLYGNDHQSYGEFRQHQAKFDSHAYDIREVSYHAKVRYRHRRGHEENRDDVRRDSRGYTRRHDRQRGSRWVRPVEENRDDGGIQELKAFGPSLER